MADFTIRDDNTKIRITCLKRDGSFFNLTGHTVKMRFRIRDVDHASVTMTIINAVGGVVEYAMKYDTGITLVSDVNNRLDVKFSGVTTSLTIPPGVYTSIQTLAAAVQTQLLTVNTKFAVSIDPSSGLVFISNTTFSFDLLFATGPTNLWSIGPTMGFEVLDYLSLPSYYATNVITAFAANDLAEEGIMYAEFEITETSTGNLVSSSEITTFVVRGKTTDE